MLPIHLLHAFFICTITQHIFGYTDALTKPILLFPAQSPETLFKARMHNSQPCMNTYGEARHRRNARHSKLMSDFCSAPEPGFAKRRGTQFGRRERRRPDRELRYQDMAANVQSAEWDFSSSKESPKARKFKRTWIN